MTDTIHTVTLTPQEQAAYASGWNRAIEAAATRIDEQESRYIKKRERHDPLGEDDSTMYEVYDFAREACEYTSHTIRALSMPAPAQAWRVKPLVWAGEEDDYAEVNEFDLRYLLMDPSSADECNGWYVLEESTNTVIEADGSIEAAKAAAQADYAARILAAMEPTNMQNPHIASQEWRDISTAPKDGTAFLAYWGYGLLDRKAFIQPMKWSEAEEKFIITWDHDDQAHPTHWMPLPEPPAALIPASEEGGE